MLVTANQIVAHLVGDYLLQNDWMAIEKTKRTLPAIAHALAYTVPFVVLTRSCVALLIIMISHFVIDRWRLARFVCYAKNYLGPRSYWYEWSKCSATGYHEDHPAWMAVWLLIIVDNTMHLLCNAAAISFL